MSVGIHVSSLLLFLLFASVQSISIPDSHHLYSALHNFDTLNKITDIRQRVARDTVPRPFIDEPKLVQFDTLERNFKLFLRPHTKPFHPRSHVQYSGNVKTRINISQYYSGHVIGAESSHVIAHLTDDGVLTAVITIGNESYYIEPSGRHFDESHDFHMISYRGSDLKFNMSGKPSGDFCGTEKGSKVNDISSQTGSYSKHDRDTSEYHNVRGRLKRQASSIPADTVCPVNLVATNSFYRHFGAENVDHTVNFLLVILLQIDTIFRSTNWYFPGVSGSASPGVRGIQIANVMVHNTSDSPSYNSETEWASDAILRDFAKSDWSDYCLAHLFTADAFTDSRRLGVAYTAFADSLRAGGICSRRTTYQNEPFSGNVGASSYRGEDRFLVLAEAIIVTAHEFGHSWGSGHDPDTNECSPPFDINGGKYLMYAFAQDGESANNKIFSSCSRQAISLVINTHESECFVEPSTDLCGNFVIDEGEDCDPGPSRMLQGGDDCCNDDCTFKTNSNGVRYECSDTNHDCCFGCAVSPVGVVCREEEVGNLNCLSNATCNGVDIICPSDPVYVAEGEPCGVMGECRNGTESNIICTNFCEIMGLTTCFCTGDAECSLCCKNTTSNGSCIPYEPATFLPKGRFCEGGMCDGEGVCQESDPDLSTYLFDLLTEFNTAAFVRFLEENIVGVVIFLSLLVWIPVSVAVHIFDVYLEKKNEKKKKQKKTEAEEKRKKKRLIGRRAVHNEIDMNTPLLKDQKEDSSSQPSSTPGRHIPPTSTRVHPVGPSTGFALHSMGPSTARSSHSIGTSPSHPVGPSTGVSPTHSVSLV